MLESAAIKDLDSSINGLSNKDVSEKAIKHGLNIITEKKRIHPHQIFANQFKSPLILILIGAVAVSILLKEILQSTVILAIIILNAIIGFIQEYKADKAIQTLRNMTRIKATVRREGKLVEIDSQDLLPGDILVISEGASIAADARLIESNSLETMEAALTGESMPVKKMAKVLTRQVGISDRTNMVYSGTAVTKGDGIAVVTATGMDREIGRIATMIQDEADTVTPLQKKLRDLSKWLGILTIAVCIIVFVVGMLEGNPLRVQFMTAISLAVAAIPEGLPAIVTISLALGIRRMIKRNVLIRNLPSVETLGCTNVICTDKTGTITHNKMTVRKLYANGRDIDVSGDGYSEDGEFLVGKKSADLKDIEMLLKIGALCNNAQGEIGDPTEIALQVVAKKAGLSFSEKREGVLPFDSERKMMTAFHKSLEKTLAYTKGAPDIVLKRCTRILKNNKVHKLMPAQRREIMSKVGQLGKESLRVLGFCYKEGKARPEEDMVFVGLQAMIDPPRKEVIEEVKRCREAGIKIVMITGDHKDTAVAIARQVGIPGKAISGDELDKIRKLEDVVEGIGVYARVNPSHKLRIVKALQKIGHNVAMTGDGVNDAPALKKAEIGICVGSGTDVAKEASDMILTDDNFVSIVNAVEEGRGIYDNIKKFVNYLLSTNFGEVLVVFFGSLLYGISPLAAVQILWINLITDGLPATALSVDPIARDIMKRKPRPKNERIITKNMTLNILLIGILICISALVLFRIGLQESVVKGTTMAFTVLVMLELVRIDMIRTQYRADRFSNKWLIAAMVLSIALHLAVLYTPLNTVFAAVPLDLGEWGLILLTCIAVYAIGRILSRSIIRVTLQED